MKKWPIIFLAGAMVAAPGAASAIDSGKICYDPQGRIISCVVPAQAAVESGGHNGANVPFIVPDPVSP